jgi:hypothetical protein
MDIYSNRSTYKLIIILFALVIGGLSVVYTNDLVNKLADRERKLIDLSAKGYKEIASAEFSESQGFLFKEIIEANTSVPVILADEEGNYISHRNFEAPKGLSPEKEADYFKAQIIEMKLQYPPILIEIAGLKQYIYYRNSDLIIQLRYYPVIQLAVIGLFISNTATAVLMAPIALGTAQQMGVSPYPFAMTIAIAASAAFMTPVSSPVNTLVLGPGNYRFADFMRIGVPFPLLVMAVSVVAIPWFFPF